MIDISLSWHFDGRPVPPPELKCYGDIMDIGAFAPRLKSAMRVFMDLHQQSDPAGIVKEGIERVQSVLDHELQKSLDAVMNQQMDYAGVRWLHEISDDGIVRILLEVTARGSVLTSQAILRTKT